MSVPAWTILANWPMPGSALVGTTCAQQTAVARHDHHIVRTILLGTRKSSAVEYAIGAALAVPGTCDQGIGALAGPGKRLS